MAESPSHKLGQIIGHLMESIVGPLLADFCKRKKFYLDYQGSKRTARKGKKVSWQDLYGNIHDLDYVIEKDGSDQTLGSPVGFVEVAWRRYTKHSRNKAQEIQGAILPLVDKYRWNNPFIGVVLAGDFTNGSITQLKSQGFTVLYFPYTTIIDAFKKEGMDIAFDERTPDREFRKRLKCLIGCTDTVIGRIKRNLIKIHSKAIKEFLSALERKLSKVINKVILIAWQGDQNEFSSVEQAISFIKGSGISNSSMCVSSKYEIIVRFSNGDNIEAEFSEKQEIQDFLVYLSGTYVSG